MKYFYPVFIGLLIGVGYVSYNTEAQTGGNNTVPGIDQWRATTSPTTAITQRIFARPIYITGLNDGCLSLVGGLLTSSGSACGSGGGSGDSVWSRTAATGLIFHATTSDSVLIGRTATTTRSKLEVNGTSTATLFNATSTTLPSRFAGGIRATASSTIGGGATTTGLTIDGGATTTGALIVTSAFARLGPCQPDYITGGPQWHFCGDNNTNAGVQVFTENKNAGASAYNGFALLNNTSVDNATNFAGIFLNSSGYNDTTFGTGLNVPNQFQVQNAVGPLTILSSTSTLASAYINFLTGTTSSSGERMRIDANGNVGIGTTSPYSMLSVAGTTTAMQFEATSTNSTSTFNGGLAVGKALRLIGLPSCDSLDTDGNGFVVCGSDATGAGGTGSNWQFYNATAIRPTSTVGITVSASSTFTADLKAASTTVEQLTVSTSTGTSTIRGPVQIGNTAGNNLLRLTSIASTSVSSSVGGQLSLVQNHGGIGAMFYTNLNDIADGRLANFRCDNDLFDNDCVHIDADGIADGFSVTAASGASNAVSLSSTGLDHTLVTAYTGTTSQKGALNVTSTNTGGSAFQITGRPAGLGVGKITHDSTGDANSSLLSLDASASGYLGQGIFLDSSGGSWVGSKILNLRANGTEYLTLNTIGQQGLGSTSPWAKLSVVGNATTTAPAFVVASSTGASMWKTDWTGTSTASNGINLDTGCFAVAGVCLSTSGVSGGTNGMLASWTGASSLTATSVPTARAYHATTSSATSTFEGRVSIGTSTPPVSSWFTVGTSSPLLVVDGNSGKIGFGSVPTTPSRWAFGIGSNVNINPNINLLVQDASDARMGVSVNDKGIFMASAGTTFTQLFGFDYAGGVPLDIQLNSFGAEVGVATSSPWGKFAILNAATSTMPAFNVASSTGTTTFTVSALDNVGVGTSSPYSRLSVVGTTTIQGSAPTSTVYIGVDGVKPGCIVMADADGSGVSYITVNNGVMTVNSTPCN